MTNQKLDPNRPRTIELETPVGATPEALWEALSTGPGLERWFAAFAEVKPGVEGSVRVAFSPGEDWTNRIEVWEENARLLISSEMPGRDGKLTRLAVEFRIETEGGTTRIRLVHSGFGGDASWDDMIDGLEAGWSYFLAHLRHCLERHPGVSRTLLSARPRCAASVEDGLRAILGAPGLALEGTSGDGLVSGRACSLRLGEERLEARVLVARPPRTASFVIPALGDAVLFVERESLLTEFRLGIWLSVYDQANDLCRRWQGDVSALAFRLAAAMPVAAPGGEPPPGQA